MDSIDWNFVFGSALSPCVLAARLTVCGVVPDFSPRKAVVMAAFVNFILEASMSLERVNEESEANCWVHSKTIIYCQSVITRVSFVRGLLVRLVAGYFERRWIRLR